MNRTRVLAALTLTAVLAGCDHKDPYVNENARLMDQAMMDTVRMQPIDQAVIAQRTLYPYHFVAGNDTLEGIGRHDLRIIVDHYRDQGVPLNVNRGEASEQIYDARVRTVAKFIADCGVPDNRIQIVQGRPGGPGLPGAWVVKILSKMEPGGGAQQPKTGVYVPPIMGGGASQ